MCIILLSEKISSLLLYSIWWNLGTLRLFQMPIKHWTQTSVCGAESELYKQISAFIYQNLVKPSKNWVVFSHEKSTWKVNKVPAFLQDRQKWVECLWFQDIHIMSRVRKMRTFLSTMLIFHNYSRFNIRAVFPSECQEPSISLWCVRSDAKVLWF